TFKAASQVRSPIAVAPVGAGQFAAYFGDGQANVYAVNAQTGEQLWKTKIEEHKLAGITGGPKIYEGRVYVGVRSGSEEMLAANPKYQCCTFRGSLAALDAGTGKQLWKTYTIPDPPSVTKKNSAGTDMYGPSGAAIWSSPTIDVKRKAVYVGTGNNYSDPPVETTDSIIAFDMKSGKIRWVRQMTQNDIWNASCPLKSDPLTCPVADAPDFDFAASPILVDLKRGRRALLAGQKSGLVYSLDPDREGKTVWQQRVGKGGTSGGIMFGPASDADNLYVAVSDA